MSSTEREYVLDVRGEECPIPEMKAAKELQKINHGKLVVITDHEPAIDVTLPALCNSLGLKYEILKDDGYVRFVIIKGDAPVKIEDVQGTAETTTIYLRRPVKLRDKLSNPTLLMGFVPQIKAVDVISPGNYMVHMKWFISWETPLFVTFEILPKAEIIYYTAYQKLPFLRVSFGWKFLSSVSGEGQVLEVKEWYKGPFEGRAKKQIVKHLDKAKEVLPRILLSEE